jgi:hypothetical protein
LKNFDHIPALLALILIQRHAEYTSLVSVSRRPFSAISVSPNSL